MLQRKLCGALIEVEGNQPTPEEAPEITAAFQEKATDSQTVTKLYVGFSSTPFSPLIWSIARINARTKLPAKLLRFIHFQQRFHNFFFPSVDWHLYFLCFLNVLTLLGISFDAIEEKAVKLILNIVAPRDMEGRLVIFLFLNIFCIATISKKISG